MEVVRSLPSRLCMGTNAVGMVFEWIHVFKLMRCYVSEFLEWWNAGGRWIAKVRCLGFCFFLYEPYVAISRLGLRYARSHCFSHFSLECFHLHGPASLLFGIWLPLHAGYDRNFSDLEDIKVALNRYRAARGAYPVSRGWSGVNSPKGYSGPDWVPGLVPEYLARLPQDPRGKRDPRIQYLYKSDGKDYKLISFGAYDCDQISARMPERVDPVRNCYAYGFWTERARRW